jgi:hypothetical protein
MKHLLNDMSFEERQNIREQHTGGMKVMSDSFRRLVNGKLGDSKPLVSEQVTTDTTTVPVTTDTTTVAGGGGAAVETLDSVLSTSTNVSFNKASIKKYNAEVVTWNQGSSGKIENTFYKNCNTGVLTNTKKATATQYQNLFSNRLCSVFFPDLQVAVRSREYSAKQAEYIKNNPLQTGPPTHYRSDG